MTKDGIGALAVGITGLVTGLLAGWNEVSLFGTLILVMLVISACFVYTRSCGQLSVSAQSITCERLSARTVEFQVTARYSAGLYLATPATSGAQGLIRAEHGARIIRFSLPVDTKKRIDGQLGPFTVKARDFFGFFQRTLSTASPVDLVVTPRMIDAASIKNLQVQSKHNMKFQRSSDKHQFSQMIREYVIGDDPRRIHWRSTARLGSLIVKEETSEFSNNAKLVLDCRRPTWNTSMGFSVDNSEWNFELAIEFFATILDQLLKIAPTVSLDFLDGHPRSFDLTTKANAMRLLAGIEMYNTNTNARISMPADAGGRESIVVTHGIENSHLFQGLFPKCIVVDPLLEVL